MTHFQKLLTAAAAFTSALAVSARAQGVRIHNATATAVVEALKTELLPQGFKVDHANNKEALFTLDRGNVSQRTSNGIQIAHVVIELQVHFKEKKDSLEVTAAEEATSRVNSGTEFRQPVRSPAEIDNLQRLLDKIKTELESQPAPADSTAKPNPGS